jgi:Divergent InlB B-repeat domain
MSPSLTRPLAAARVLLAAMLLAGALATQSAASATAVAKCGVLPGHTCARLTISLFGNGSGRFQSIATDGGAPTGQIDCQRSGGVNSGTCASTFDIGTSGSDTLYWRETPAAGSNACWIYAGCFPNGFDTDTTLSGTGTDSDHFFKLVNPATVSVTKKGNGSGSVKSNPRGISCGGTCHVDFASGQPVTLTAKAAGGSVFGGWSNGPCSGKSATCTFTPTAATVIDATFNAVSVPAHAPSDSRTIQPSPSAGPSELVEAASAGSSASASPSASSTPPAAAPDPPSSGSDNLPIAIAIVLAAFLIGAGLAIGLVFGPRSRSAKPPA